MSQSEVLWKKEILVFPTNGFKLHLHKRYQLQEFQQFQCSQIAQIFFLHILCLIYEIELA